MKADKEILWKKEIVCIEDTNGSLQIKMWKEK